MADYAISNVARRVVYANTGVGPYAFTFEILANTDIAVYRGSTLLTLTTDYSVTINANGTGSITLVTAGTGNITIVGARAIQRTSDYTTGGDLFASTLNTDLDSQTIYAQQVAETAERGLKAPVVDPTDINMTLPAKANRAGTVLAFDSPSGNPVAGPTIAAVGTVSGNIANINTVAGISANVTTVAGISSNVTTVAGISGNVTTVANNNANITTVADDLNEPVSEINTVATNIANVNTVGNNISNVNTVAGISANVTSVAGNATNINTVAGISSDISAVAAIDSDVTTVAGIDSDVTAVAADATDIGTVASNIANVNTVAGISGNVTTVAGISANVTSVAGNSTNINSVAGNSANINTVAGISANVTTVAGISANVTTVATNVADVTNYADTYLGPKISDPATRNDSSALQAGDLYFNTVDDVMKVYSGSAWIAAYVSLAGALIAANNLSDLTNTATARSNLGLGSSDTPTFAGLTDSGNLTFTGTGNRITGDFSNATVASRVAFQSSTTNGNTTVYALPNGTATTSGFFANTDSTLTNGSEVRLSVDGTTVTLNSAIRGSGTYLPLTLNTGGSERLRIDTSGNVGIGTNSPQTKLHLQDNAAVFIQMTDAGDGASRIGQNGTALTFGVDGSSGTTERMRITSAGGVSFGSSGTAYGTAGQVLTSAGDAPPTWTTIAPTANTYDTGTAATWTKPSSANWVLIEIWGGGGSGGKGVASGPAGGGGGGAYNSLLVRFADLQGTVTYTVGAGGAAQTTGSTSGNNGGTSSVTMGTYAGGGDKTLFAYGGAFGAYAATGGNGGGGGGIFTAGSGADGGSPEGGFGGSVAGIQNGGNAVEGGGGGGCGIDGAGIAANNRGGNSKYGGGGGGGAANSVAGGNAGTSIYGGDGSAGAIDANASSAGTTPAGGSGGTEGGNSGAGGSGRVRFTYW